MREFVKVKGPAGSRVFVDGGDTGETNTVLFVETGTHIFGLTDDVTCPPSVTVIVENTSDLQPMVIDLNAAAPAAAKPSKRRGRKP
jgi:hypothetical protein